GVEVAYYLVHNLEAEGEFATLERAQALTFGRACRRAGVPHVIYLGGLYPDDELLSQHLASRREVGDILRRECGALVVRAGIIIGSGSASFEIMRDLVSRLPAMVAPRWVGNRCQPIHIDDVIETLARARGVEGDREVDLAGPETITYGEMLKRLGRALGRTPMIVPVPVLTPQLSSHWLRFITAVPLPVAQALVNSLRHEAVATRPILCSEVGVDPRSFDDAVAVTLARAASVTVSGDAVSHHENGAFTLRQTFAINGVEWNCDASLLGRIDAALFRSSTRSVPFLRWSGTRLSMGGVTLIALSSLRAAGHGSHLSRQVTGGLLATRRGGQLTYACPEGMPAAVVVGLEDLVPRLPRRVYLRLQEPLHRRMVRLAVKMVAREQT
ncbi:MAG TPA: hypothetical protein VGR61_06190, partial [Candidatus Dormibacteraeota bacterium]|nr:hypothetical protein [Candidatus Dormibacteraeota bacterium]